MLPRKLKEIKGGECYDEYFIGGGGAVVFMEDASGSADGQPRSGARDDFSETNAQESGVAEADIVKADSESGLIFMTSRVRGNNNQCEHRFSILRDGESEKLELVGSIPLMQLVTTPSEMLIANNVVLLIGTAKLYYEDVEFNGIDENRSEALWWWPTYEPAVMLLWIDISNPTTPTLIRRQVREGMYVDSRRVDDHAYIVITRVESWGALPRAGVPFFRDEQFTNDTIVYSSDKVPDLEKEATLAADQGATEPSTSCEEVGYSWPILSELGQFTAVVAVPMSGDATVRTPVETLATRADATVYASRRNLYVTQVDYVAWQNDIDWPTKYRTIIFRFELDGSSVAFKTSYSVPGQILNQFAMSETSDGSYLRVATTSRPANGNWTDTSNALFVFDVETGRRVGGVTGLAPGESIYSVRFMGDTRCYMVTFVQVDPLFVIGLDDPFNPVVLGELKIEGFSSYLHPLNNSHLIGLGREVALVERSWGLAVIEQGIQLQLFDISNDSKPELDYTLIIGDLGSWSEVLYEHKAFQLYDDRIIAFPTSIASVKAREELENTSYVDDEGAWGLETFQGVLLFKVMADGRIEPMANVTHLPPDFFAPVWVSTGEDEKSGYWQDWFDTVNSGYHIKRTLARGDHLYSFSDNAVTKTSLDDANLLLSRIELNDSETLAKLQWAIA